MSTFTVAICTHNRADLLSLCLESLAASLDVARLDVPVVIIDNASTDDTARVVASFGDRLALRVVSEPRRGISHARNAAFAACETEYLVFLDDDAKPLPGWAAAVADGIEQWEPDVFGGPYRPFYLDSKPSWMDDALGSAHTDLTPGLQPAGTYFSGGNMGWRTDLFHSDSGFDIDLGMTGDVMRLGEETQLQNRFYAERPDLRVVFLPDMEMLHLMPTYKMSVRYWWRRSWDYGWRLHEIDPGSEIEQLSSLDLVRQTRAGLPLLLRLVLRDRTLYPQWKSYAVAYGGRNGILAGLLARRLFRR